MLQMAVNLLRKVRFFSGKFVRFLLFSLTLDIQLKWRGGGRCRAAEN
jgi:hypothetical protein